MLHKVHRGIVSCFFYLYILEAGYCDRLARHYPLFSFSDFLKQPYHVDSDSCHSTVRTAILRWCESFCHRKICHQQRSINNIVAVILPPRIWLGALEVGEAPHRTTSGAKTGRRDAAQHLDDFMLIWPVLLAEHVLMS